MNAWVNFIGYQLVWFAVVGTATGSRLWIGLTAAAAFILAQMALSERRLLDVRMLIVAFVTPICRAIAGLALGWAIAMTVLFHLARRWRGGEAAARTS